jgi:hypothetical protein
MIFTIYRQELLRAGRARKPYKGKKEEARKQLMGENAARISSFARGRTINLAEVSGHSGVVRRIWMTLQDLSPIALKRLRISFYWDGCEEPAVNVPLGDFFCMGPGHISPFESKFFSSLGEGAFSVSYLCLLEMACASPLLTMDSQRCLCVFVI